MRPAGGGHTADVPEQTVDAVVSGAGPNGLVAANLLADAGWDVCLVEAAEHVGGAVASVERPPGYVSDLFSAFYPLAAASPIIEALDLGAHDLTWRRAPAVVAHPAHQPGDHPAATLQAPGFGDPDGQRGEHERLVAEDRFAGERRDDLGDDAEEGQRDDVHLGMAEEPEQVLPEHRAVVLRGEDRRSGPPGRHRVRTARRRVPEGHQHQHTVISVFQVKIGIRNSVIPGARMQMIVVIRLTVPRMVANPPSASPNTQRFEPKPGLYSWLLSGL
jgi:hypothetical protein